MSASRTGVLIFSLLVVTGCKSASDSLPPEDSSPSTDAPASTDGASDGANDTTVVDDATKADVALDSGATCTTALDCGDVAAFGCDPATKHCRKADCDGATACPAGKSCVPITSASAVGLCLPSCPKVGESTGCADGEVCVGQSLRVGNHCLKRGTAMLGADCTISDDSTGCAEGVCRAVGLGKSVCVQDCDLLSSGSCPTDKFCSTNWDCALSTTDADPAGIEELCSVKDHPCGVADGVQHGHCVAFYGGVTICRALCSDSVGCPSSFVCAHLAPFTSAGGLGVCMPAVDGDACQDGGSGDCVSCRTTEQASGGCCAKTAASCTSDACKSFVDCAVGCKRNSTCVNACAAADAVAAKEGTPLFLCLTAYGAPPGGACGDVCNGPMVCGDYDGPDVASTCKTCSPTGADCRANGCFNGFYCNRATLKCTAPSALPACGDGGVDGS